MWENVVVFSTECRQLKGSARVAFDIEVDLRAFFDRENIEAHVEEKKITFTCRTSAKKPLTLLATVITEVFNPRGEFLTKLKVVAGDATLRRDYAGDRSKQRADKAERSAVANYKLKGDGYIAVEEDEQ